MNAFQSCNSTKDLVPLYLPQRLYLKPIARLNVSLQLPNAKRMGKSISHWEIMDKIRELAKPEEFTVLKVTKTTVEFVRFEAEIQSRCDLERVVAKLNNKMVKLKNFSDLMKLRAAEWKSDFPNRRAWDEYFQNTKDMDEMKPGERPDTIHLSNLPSRWFCSRRSSQTSDLPSEKMLYRVFEKFGTLRYVDIPICDPYRKKMKDHISGFRYTSEDKKDVFEGYVQFRDYIGFTKAMDALRDMKLVHKDDDDEFKEIDIRVDFDKSKHLSDASIRRREIVRDRLVQKAREKEEKEKAELEEKKRMEEVEKQKEIDLKAQKELRRKLREEKRKAKILKKLEITGTDEINEKIAKEEKKLLKVQRKLEAIRLVEELFKRIKEKNPDKLSSYETVPSRATEELQRFKNSSELEVLTQREKLHHAIKGRVMLKTILSDSKKVKSYSSSSSDTDLSLDEPNNHKRATSPVIQKYPELMYDSAWLSYYHLPPGIPGAMYPEFMDGFNPMRGFYPRGRGYPRFPLIAGPSRGGFNRRRGGFQPRHRNRGGKRFSNERDTKGSFPRRRSRSASRNWRRSYSTSYSRSRSRSRSRKRHRSRSYSSRSRSRSKSRYTPKRSRSRSKSRRRSRSRTKSRERSREKSVDSSTFLSRREVQENSVRGECSRSSSVPRSGENKGKSGSKSPKN